MSEPQPNETFGQWLRSMRKRKGLTQLQLSIRIPISEDMIRKLESGDRKPSPENAEVIADFFHVLPEQRPAFINFARGVEATEDEVARVPMAVGLLPARKPGPPPNNLPPQRTAFIGRTREVERLRAMLLQENIRLVTLTGPPGIGKTRLSLEVAGGLAERFGDGVCFVPLSPLSDPAMVLPAITQALKIKEAGGQDRLSMLKSYLGEKEVLLVLDNFEHVMQARNLVVELVEACPGLKLIVSSREALKAYGEHQFPVPAMPLPEDEAAHDLQAISQYEAVELFAQRAGAVNPDFQLTEQNAQFVVKICRRLDGLPLAIELAAARMKLFTLQALLGFLDDSMGLLKTRATDLPDRQKTLQGAIDWSYNLLTHAEQAVLRRMSVFVGGCTIAAIEWMMNDGQRTGSGLEGKVIWPGENGHSIQGDGWPVNGKLDKKLYGLGGGTHNGDGHGNSNSKSHHPFDLLETLQSLVDKSLIRQTEADGDPRFNMLWTIREYSLVKLAESGEENIARRLHATYFLDLAQTAEPGLTSADRGRWLQRLDKEHYNLLEALEWCCSEDGDAETGLRLAGALGWYWFFKGYTNEGMHWLPRAMALGESARGTQAWAHALNSRMPIAIYADTRDNLPLDEWAQEAVDAWEGYGSTSGLAYALSWLGYEKCVSGHEDGLAFVERGIGLFRLLGDKWGLAYALDYMALAETWLGHSSECVARTLESLTLYRELDSKWDIAFELNQLGTHLVSVEDYDSAWRYLTEALTIERELGDRWTIMETLIKLGETGTYRGDYDAAVLFFEEALEYSEEVGARLYTAWALQTYVYLRLRIGQLEEATALFRRSAHMYHGLVNKPSPFSLLGLACLQVGKGDHVAAARSLGTLTALRGTQMSNWATNDRIEYNRCLSDIQGRLDGDTFKAVWAEGEKMSLDQALLAVELL